MSTLAVTLGGIAILLAVVFLIQAEFLDFVEDRPTTANVTQGDYGEYNETRNAIQQTTEATADIPGFLPIIVITVIGGILLALVRFFRQ